MTSVSVHGVAGPPGGPLIIALDGAAPAPGILPGDTAPASLDGFHKVLTQHIKHINKQLQHNEQKEQNIIDGSAVAALPPAPEAIDRALLASGIEFQTVIAGRLDQLGSGSPGSGTVALVPVDQAGPGGGKDLPAGGEALPNAAAARTVPGDGAGLGSAAAQFSGAMSRQTFAAISERGLTGQGTLAQLAETFGGTSEDLAGDPRALLRAAAVTSASSEAVRQVDPRTPTAEFPGVPATTAAAVRAVSSLPAGLAGQLPTGEPGSIGVGARDTGSAGASPAIAQAIGGGSSGSAVAAGVPGAATGIGAAEISAMESLAAMVQRTRHDTTASGTSLGGTGISANTVVTPAVQQAGVAIPFERMVAGRNQQVVGSSAAVAGNVQSPGAGSEGGGDPAQSTGVVAGGSERDRRIGAMALSTTRVPQDGVDTPSDQRVAVQSPVPTGLHGVSPMHPSPAPRIDSTSAGVPAAALPLASGDWGGLLGERIRWLSSANMDAADIRLDPPELGPLQVKVQAHRDGASVQFTTHSAVVRDMVEQSLPRLREMLEGSGMSLLDVNVAQQQNGGGRGHREALAQNASWADPVLALDTATELPATVRTPRGLVDYYA